MGAWFQKTLAYSGILNLRFSCDVICIMVWIPHHLYNVQPTDELHIPAWSDQQAYDITMADRYISGGIIF